MTSTTCVACFCKSQACSQTSICNEANVVRAVIINSALQSFRKKYVKFTSSEIFYHIGSVGSLLYEILVSLKVKLICSLHTSLLWLLPDVSAIRYCSEACRFSFCCYGSLVGRSK